jgi:hypothetical protein
MNNEPVAIRYDFDGYGYQYMDSGSGSDWQTRVDGELLYADPVKELPTKEDEYWLMVEMLRAKVKEQQAEINALKKEAALQRLSDFTQEAECKHGVDDGACKECYQESTEPVALTQVEIMNALTLGIPLYTHPVKELTIEEIEEVSKEIFKGYKNFYHYQINFARAILRKAQE